MKLNNVIENLKKDKQGSTDFSTYQIYIKANLSNMKSSPKTKKAQNYLEKVTIDIGGLIGPTSNTSKRYYLTFLDLATRYLSLALLLN